MQKKVGIVTGFDRYNFGNRLQNYAVQTTLTRIGLQCETLVPQALYDYSQDKPLKRIAKWIACTVAAEHLYERHPDAVRNYRIDQFNKNISFRAVTCQENFFPKTLAQQYDYFVAGSDQVWNPYFWKSSIGSDAAGFHNNLLCFARPEQRRCFSPSFGISALPEEWNDPFNKELQKFPYLGVREAEGAHLIEELTGKKSAVTLDPTLMLSREDWLKVCRPINAKSKKKYVLYLMLGSIHDEIPTDKKTIINQITAKHGFETRQMLFRKRPEWFACGAGEFIDLIQNAEIICTDSFHCTVFSIIFGKPFLLFPRILKKYNIDMSSRTDTLLNMIQLERKKTENQLWDEKRILECNYQDNLLLLDQKRESTMKFLKESFDV